MPVLPVYAILMGAILTLLSCKGVSAEGDKLNRPVPPAVIPYQFQQFDTNCHGYYLTVPVKVRPTRMGDGSVVQPEMILDCNGYMVWYDTKPPTVVNSDFKYFPQHRLFTYCAIIDSVHYVHYVLDSTLTIIDSVINVNGVLPAAHEFRILPNGNFLISGRLDSVVDLGKDTFNGKPGSASTKIMGFVIQEFDRNHNLVFQWNSNQHINPADQHPSYGYKEAGFDYCHGNAVELCVDGNYLVSFRHLNAVYKIERPTGKVLWKLGGKNSSFTFTNDAGFSGQHDCRELPNGNITVFDNANTAPVPQHSRAVEYKLDTLARTATLVWSYTPSSGLYASGMGNFQTTASGLRLINYGLLYRPHPSITLVDDSQHILTQIVFKDSFMSYRSHMVDLPFKFPRPAITSKKDKDGITVLSAPVGFKRYVWSNGQTGRSIRVEKPGVYQVWVNYGIGMLGSYPYRIISWNSNW